MALAILGLAGAAAGLTGVEFRKDYYLPNDKYKESWAPLPTGGGRAHFVLTGVDSSTAKQPLSAEVGGVTIPMDPSQNPFSLSGYTIDWLYVRANPVTKVAVVSMHTQNDSFVNTMQSTGTVTVKDAAGTVLGQGNLQANAFTPTNGGVGITYVTTRGGYSRLVAHIHNHGSTAANVSLADVNGQGASGIPSFTLGAGEHEVVDVPVKTTMSVGFLWSVVISVDGRLVGNGGRVLKEQHFVEGWCHSDQCVIPSGKNDSGAANWKAMSQDFGVNSVFKAHAGCGLSSADVLASASQNSFYVFWDMEGDAQSQKPPSQDFVAIAFMGDEVDSDPAHVQRQWSQHLRVTQALDDRTGTYQGAQTNHRAGVFSGVTDVQGIDYYVAGCAPTVTPVTQTLQLQGSHDYLRNERDNHMPLPMWGYSQGLTNDWQALPRANEIIIQIASAYMAGSKSLMLFQIDETFIGKTEFTQVGNVLKSFALVGESIRSGDIGGAVVTSSDGDGKQSMIEVVAAPNNTFLVMVANFDASGYSGLLCHTYASDHWKFSSHTVDSIKAQVRGNPGTAPNRIASFNEIVAGARVPSPSNFGAATFDASSRTLSLTNVALDSTTTVRIFEIVLSI
eukprot:Hpha_TRINITY_DN11746_c0_g2::TRINITY_DN11746_c0_g2_i1::g.31956::m.31956